MIGLLITPFLFNVNAKFHNYMVLNPKSSKLRINADDVDMLIFLSPQYAEDEEILQAINNYKTVVEEDVNWSTNIIKINSEINDFKDIDNIIESYYENNSVKACIMVGEDTDTALCGDTDFNEAPSTVPWYTTGGEDSYTIGKYGVMQGPQQMDICVSLIYPTSDLDYQTKKSQIISVFNKFSIHRHVYYTKDILVFIDAEMAQLNNNKARYIYQSMDDYGNLYYKEDPTKSEVMSSLEGSYSMYFAGGHSTPSGTDVNSTGCSPVLASYLDELDAPFFGTSGCYVDGWWSAFPDNNRLDPSITKEGGPHFGAMIFTAPQLHVLLLGFLSQSSYLYHSFIEQAVPDLTSGATLADSMIGHTYSGDDQTVVGDPTFCYSFENSPPPEPYINGTANGRAGKSYDYTFTVDEPDKDAVYYYIEWGDNTTEDWIGLYDFEEPAKVSHVWEEDGNYTIKAKAKDSYGEEGNWSYLEVSIPKNKSVNFNFNPYNNFKYTKSSLLLRFLSFESSKIA